jgi:predicted RNA-binding protein with PIN domain
MAGAITGNYFSMPVIIDGYNLYHFARSVYVEDGIELALSAFVSIIDEWTRRSRQKVTLVFDGSVPPVLRQNSTNFGSVAIEFSGPASDADSVIERHVLVYSAPKLLTIVSSDHRVQKAGRRRHCKVLGSDAFWKTMAKKLTAKLPAPEPRQKKSGLFSYEVEYWLKVFGFDEPKTK